MYSHILVPVDLSGGNAAALNAAAAFARDGRAEVTLLHVVQKIDGIPDENLQDFYAELTSKAQRTLAGWADELRGKGCHAKIIVLRGTRAREIVRYAEDSACDLVLLATHRIGPDRPEGALGTMSHQIALLAPCSVLLVRS